MSNLDKYKRDYAPRHTLESRLAGSSGRTVPLSAMVALVFGNGLTIAGWIVFAFGMCLGWAGLLISELPALFIFSQPLTKVDGRVRDVTTTSSEENDIIIYRIAFDFTDSAGVAREGSSFSTGEPPLKDSQTAPVEYVTGNPKHARLVGYRSREFSAWLGVMVIAPAVGFCLVLIGVFKGAGKVGLVRRGKLAKGKLLSTEPTNTTINNRRVMKLTFGFTADDGKAYTFTHRTHHPEKLQDDAEERLLYDPDNPSRAFAVDALPGGLSLNERGDANPPSPLRMAFALGIPALGIAIHGLVAAGWILSLA